MIDFECECGEPLAAVPEDAGATVQCPKCGRTLEVPDPGYRFEPDGIPLSSSEKPIDPFVEGREQARRMMSKAHDDWTADEANRAREWRPVVFTPGLLGGLAVFTVCTLLAVLSLFLYNLYLAIGLLFFAVLGLIRAFLSFIGRGVD